MCPCSANLSASLFPSMVPWDGTLTHWNVHPVLSSLRSKASHKRTLDTGPEEPF